MALVNVRLLYLKLVHAAHDIPRAVNNTCSVLYCQLYKFINTSCMMQTIYSLYYGAIAFFTSSHQNLECKTHWQSPVCRTILRRKYFLTRSKHSLAWAVCFSILAALLFLELRSSHNLFGLHSDIVWYVELVICCVLTFNAVIALSIYIWSVLSSPLPISPMQHKLFRISEKDPGFEVKKVANISSENSKSERVHFMSWRDSYESSPPSMLSVTPINLSFNSWMSSPFTSPDTTSSSWNFYRASSPISFSSSTPKSLNLNRSMLRRLNYTDDLDSPYERPIKNKKQLEDYLQTQEESKRMKSMSFDETKPFMSKMMDNSPMSVLSKCRYQRACRLPHSETTEDNSSEVHCCDILNKLKVTDKMITIWCERMRKWICQTILVRLVREIDDINSTLSEIGLPEFQIGNVSLAALHQISTTKAQHLPTLAAVLPYINMHSNQEYLVKRLRDLAHGGCMGEFKWNSGASLGDKQWSDDLPTDSTLISHILFCYFDAHLPPDPHFPEGKPFSSKYFKKTPEKAVLSKDAIYIYQSNLHPPHFKVVIGEEVYTLPRGRNNLFCALGIFLQCMKIKECGMLGRVNLGPSGLNMLWVID